MEIELFNFNLPDDHIAYHPASMRDLSRLMILDRHDGQINHRKFLNIDEYFNPGDGLVVNDTKVFKARFWLRRQTGGKIEIFLLEETKYNDKYCWKALSHPSRRLKFGEKVFLNKTDFLTLETKLPDGKSVISFESKADSDRLVSRYGNIPLPIYIHRPAEKKDINRYQTIYANPKKDKSVAAPTAGLHFTNRVINKLKAKKVEIIPITLHVGYGTFKPVKADNIDDHQVDAEYAEISKASANKINKIRSKGGKIFAVGTTSVRTLESADIVDGLIQPYKGFVGLYIKPGFEFNVVDHLITNFHLPKSSLILLVSALAGREKILEAYNLAVKEKYRFYSYGDCMLIL